MREIRLNFEDKDFIDLERLKEDEKEKGYIKSWEQFILLSAGLMKRRKKDGSV
jgi:hypothetical protein